MRGRWGRGQKLALEVYKLVDHTKFKGIGLDEQIQIALCRVGIENEKYLKRSVQLGSSSCHSTENKPFKRQN